MKNKQIIRSITEGAIYVAVYGILAVITRYLFTGTDSFIYYLYPLPIAIFSAKTELKYSISALLASILLSFLFTNYIYVLGLIMPNLLIGYIFGLLSKFINNKLFIFLIIFILCFLADLLSIYIYEKITGIGYFSEMLDFVLNFGKKLIPNMNEEMAEKIIKVSGIAVLLIDSVVKEIFIYLLFSIIVIRLKLIKNYKLSFRIRLLYHYVITLSYISNILLLLLFTYLTFNKYLMIYEIIMIILLVIFFLFSVYLIYQFDMYLRIKIKGDNKILLIILILLSFILFPISILISLFLNLINYNYLKNFI